MKNLIRDTIEKIEKQRIVPQPKWKYLVKKYGIWMLFVLVLGLAAISFSAIYNNVSSLDWDLYLFMRQNMFIYFLSIIPYFWVILIAVFSVFAFFEIRRTENGYRYSWLKIVTITFGSIVVLAICVSLFGFGGRLNATLAKDFPFSQHMMATKESQWMQPERGFLAGVITSVSENKLEINDLNGKNWNIITDEKTMIRPAVDISQKEVIKIIGTKQDNNNFKAEEIRPWSGMGTGNGTKGQNRTMTSSNGRGGGMMRGN